MRESVLELDDARLACRIDGSGPDVVLVHAGVADLRMWDPLVALLAPERRLVRFDMRGFGATASGRTPFAPGDDLAAVVAALAPDAPLVVGASFGALVALEYAATHPEGLRGLVLLDPPLPGHAWSGRMEAFDAAETAALGEGRIDDAVALNVGLWAGEAGAAVRELVALMQRRAFELQLACEPQAIELEPPVRERLADVRVPVTVACGERDVEDFTVIAARLAAELPRARLATVPDAGHLPALERPEEVAALVLAAG